MSGFDPDDPTMAMCIRCGQVFPAHDRCPHCRDLNVLVFEEDDPQRPGPWVFEVWQGERRGGAGSRPVFALGGFQTAADARARAYEFIRFVTQRISRGGVP
jgi:hypothetical protein